MGAGFLSLPVHTDYYLKSFCFARYFSVFPDEPINFPLLGIPTTAMTSLSPVMVEVWEVVCVLAGML